MTSATRTYFVRLTNEANPTFQVSDAWLVGRPDYLRAWACLHYMGRDEGLSLIQWTGFRTTLQELTPEHSPEQPRETKTTSATAGSRKRAGSSQAKPGRGGGRAKRAANSEHPVLLLLLDELMPHVPIEDIEIKCAFGYGKNGTTFKAVWKGTEVAMKQFDLGKGGDMALQSEMTAYAMLEDVWGVLVPKPLFLSESLSEGVVLLGLQLGRDVTEDDNVSVSRRNAVRDGIYEHGIRLLDHEGRTGNFLFLPERNGCERLVAIDLEDYELVDRNPVPM
jgi:hypothetical protein